MLWITSSSNLFYFIKLIASSYIYRGFVLSSTIRSTWCLRAYVRSALEGCFVMMKAINWRSNWTKQGIQKMTQPIRRKWTSYIVQRFLGNFFEPNETTASEDPIKDDDSLGNFCRKKEDIEVKRIVKYLSFYFHQWS